MLFNLVPLIFVVAFMAIGSKRGFVRELMGIVALCAALIITTGKLDFIAVEIAGAIDASPLTVSIIAFVIVLGLTFGLFKLVAKLLYKLIEIQKLGQRDKYGGAIIGAVRGWLIVGALLFVTVLVPLPRPYYTLMDQSVLATSSLRSIQYLYDVSEPLHPEWPSFLVKVENSLTSPDYDKVRQGKDKRSVETRIKDEIALRQALNKLHFYYGDADEF
ncbi:MAG: CvpA family protein [candidate division Zixibacteria bacterium]|nr:CvpA family protein [candidate division Zixibacteria bacterium]